MRMTMSNYPPFTKDCYLNRHQPGVKESSIHNTIYCETCHEQNDPDPARNKFARGPSTLRLDSSRPNQANAPRADGGKAADVQSHPYGPRCVECNHLATHRFAVKGADRWAWHVRHFCLGCLNAQLGTKTIMVYFTRDVTIEAVDVEDVEAITRGVEGLGPLAGAPIYPSKLQR